MSIFKQSSVVLVVLSLLLFIFPTSSYADQLVSPSVPILDSVYNELEILTAYDLIEAPFYGFRPYTRQQFIHWIEEAENNFFSKQKEYSLNEQVVIQNTFKILRKTFYKELLESNKSKKTLIQVLDTLDFNVTYLNQNSRPYFADNSRIAADYLPLVQWDNGRHYAKGFQYALETSHYITSKPYYAVYVQPRVQVQLVDNTQTKSSALFLQQLYLSLNFWNTQIDVGRKEIVWGFSPKGGMLLSSNARPLDGVFITNPRPWNAGFLGKFKYSLFLVNLGPEQRFDYDFFTGIKLGFMPFRWLEFNIARALIFKGEGAPDGSVLDFVMEYFGMRPGDINKVNISNSINGVEAKLTLPFLRNTQIYSELYFDDFNLSHMIRSVKQDSCILFGTYIPRLDQKGSLTLRLEGRKTTNICYKHSRWADGWVINRFIMGDPIGADAESLAIYFSKTFSNHVKWDSSLFFERIDSDVYSATGDRGRFVTTNGTAEKRVRFLASLNYPLSKVIHLRNTVGYERVINHAFNQGTDRNDFLVSMNLRFNFSLLP
jgi:hypothetical protein